MNDNITNYSPSLITGGFLPPLFGGERGCGGKGGGSALELLDAEIKQLDAKEVSAHPEWDEVVERLEKCFIDRDTQLIEQKHLLEINGVKCFPRGDLIALSGKEKCGKTTACRILATALLKGEYDGMRALEENLRILWIDTEQARISTRTVSRGIDMMCGFRPTADQIRFLNLREWGDKPSMRIVLQVMFDSFRPDFVILDGIRDFIDDFNDVRESADIVLEVMRLSSGVSAEEAKEKKLHERLPCSIACILHQNKPKDDNNMRGHLGTELANKAGEVWESTRSEGGLFEFTQTRSRTRPLEEAIRFKVFSKTYIDATGRVEEIGIPEMWKADQEQVVIQEESLPKETLIETRHHGTFTTSPGDAQWLLWNAMRDNHLGWNEMIKYLCDYYGFDRHVAMCLKKYSGNQMERDSDGKWYYIGPSFEEPLDHC